MTEIPLKKSMLVGLDALIGQRDLAQRAIEAFLQQCASDLGIADAEIQKGDWTYNADTRAFVKRETVAEAVQ